MKRKKVSRKKAKWAVQVPGKSAPAENPSNDDQETGRYGGLPARDLKKNLGCG